ncbi:MAG: phage tail protein, partial [Pseudomonadota bacterium]
MTKVVKVFAAAGFIALGVLTGGVTFLPGTALAFTVGSATFLTVGLAIGASLLQGSLQNGQLDRAAAAAQLQLGENPRAAVVGRSGLAGTLVDAFNFGGDDGTDWEVLVVALADHECDALEGFYVNDAYSAFTGDGPVAGFNGQLEVYWRPGTWDQDVPQILIDHGPGWTANDRGRGVSYAVFAYKADEPEAEDPVWPAGRPRFKCQLRGLKCYQARLDDTVGGSGTHRIDDPSTWGWTENLIDIRYNWVRGIYAGNRNDQPEMLLIGRGLSATEAPPENVFARANLCDEIVDGEPRYAIGGLIQANESFLEVERAFAAACAGTIVQREGSVEIDPGAAQAVVATFTDDDLITSSRVSWSEFLGQDDNNSVNTVVVRFIDPAQQWTERSAPVRRDTADVIADGGPREQSPSLSLVSSVNQAQRVAEIFRRLGRLWGRASVTLPPRYTFIEEGDWVKWQSARRFNGATKTFRVEAWTSAQNWHHQLTLREINSSVFLETAPEPDNAIANQSTAPGAAAAPDAADFASIGGEIAGTNGAIPAVFIDGTVSRSNVDRVRFEIREQADPGSELPWEQVKELGR